MIKGIIFDMDGTLFDTERLYYDCWQQVAREHGYELPDALLDSMRGASLKRGAELFDAYYKGERTYMKERARRQELVLAAIAERGVPFRPGLRTLFDYMKSEGIKIALATSTHREVAELYLDRSGLRADFDAIITGNMVERGKPEPDIFLLAAARAGLKPEDCAVAEDSRNGLIGARLAGCKVFFIPDMSVVTEADKAAYVDVTFDSLDEIVGYLKAERA